MTINKLQRLIFTNHYNLIVRLITDYSTSTSLTHYQQDNIPAENYNRLQVLKTTRKRLQVDDKLTRNEDKTRIRR